MKRTSALAVLLFLIAVLPAAAEPQKKFPALDAQLRKARAKPGSALDRLIRAHQDFTNLEDRDAGDRIVPPWLKVYWRNNLQDRAEENYDNAQDPTGGYP